MCDQSVCSIYLKAVSTMIKLNEFTYEKWKNLMTSDMYNRRIGGKFCRLLIIYGWSLLIPILLNLAFHISIFYRDLKHKKVSRSEFIAVLILCYPQWRCVKLLANYFYHKDENTLQNEKQTYQREVETVEAFVESGIQVKIIGLIDEPS